MKGMEHFNFLFQNDSSVQVYNFTLENGKIQNWNEVLWLCQGKVFWSSQRKRIWFLYNFVLSHFMCYDLSVVLESLWCQGVRKRHATLSNRLQLPLHNRIRVFPNLSPPKLCHLKTQFPQPYRTSHPCDSAKYTIWFWPLLISVCGLQRSRSCIMLV